MYVRTDTPTVGADVRACSNCDRPATREGEAELGSRPAVYSCPTCGQREAVSWRTIPPRVVEAIEVVKEPHVILGEY